MKIKASIQKLFSISALLFMGEALLNLSGCHSPSSSDDPELNAPTSLSYTVSSAKYTKNTTITANRPTVDQDCDDWTISPDLPTGLEMDSVTGIITGTPSGLQIEAETYTVTASNSDGSTSTTISIQVFGYINLNIGQSANVVIGESDFGTNTAGNSESDLGLLRGNPTIVDPYLYLPDKGNNRVLIYNNAPTFNGTSANYALGQTNLTNNTANTTAGGLSGPQSVFYNGDKFFAVDTTNHRVLIYNSAPTTTGASANIAVGAADLTTAGDLALNASNMSSPASAYATKGKLIVADSGNNRVLIWNSIPTSHGQAADLVLGQTGFTTDTTATTAQTMDTPTDVWSDGERLFVVDSNNNRVLIWTSFPTANGQAANLVLGQANLTSGTANLNQTGLNTPNFITSNGNQIFVGDSVNERVMIWNSIPSVNNAQADVVLGQNSFTNNVTGMDASRFMDVAGVFVSDGYLYVADNFRYLIFYN
ncbi:MAG: putative Ig domain-containing protein [Bacteroidales bacterium]|jgi:hypothetical protein|nr:putative Ig domain-containing protein [Bacteroidales bacterium]